MKETQEDDEMIGLRKKNQNKDTLKKQLYMYFFKVLLLTGLFINFVLLCFFTYREQEVVSSGRQWMLYQTITYSDRIMEEVQSIGEAIWTSSQVQGLKAANLQKIDYLSFLDCMNYLTNMELSVSSIYRIRLYYADTNTLVTSRNGVFYKLNESTVSYYRDWMETLDESTWVLNFGDGLIDDVKLKRQMITHVRPIYSTATGKKIGLVNIEIPLKTFYDLINQDAGGKEGFAIVKDAKLLTSKTHQEEIINDWSLEGGLVQEIAEKKEGTKDFYYEGQRFRCVFETSDYSGWTFLTYYPHQYLPFDQLPFLLCCFLFLFSLITAYMMIIRVSKRKIIDPVATLRKAMKQIEEGKFGVQIKETRSDVFGEIFYCFDHMSARSKELIEELIVERLRMKDSKLKMLQSQIKPHFLYNIFNNMIWMSEQKNYEGLEQMIYATAGYYKTSLNFGQSLICLADNLKQLQYYSKIQQIRFPDQFECEINFQEDILSLGIPNLLLQPVLENAIQYGATRKDGKTNIRIHGYKKDHTIYFEFYDNGAGIEKERLKQIRNAIYEEGYQGTEFFALTNIAERLRMYYPGVGRVTVDSSYGEWTLVVLRVSEEEPLCIN